MKNILLLFAVVSLSWQFSSAQGTDIEILTNPNYIYSFQKTAISSDNDIFIYRVFKKLQSEANFRFYQLLKSTDNGATFTVVRSNEGANYTDLTYNLEEGDMITAGTGQDIAVWITQYRSTTTVSGALELYYLKKTDNYSVVNSVSNSIPNLNAFNTNNVRALALITTNEASTSVSPYCMGLAVAYYSAMADTLSLFTSNTPTITINNAWKKQRIKSTSVYIREISVAMSILNNYPTYFVAWSERSSAGAMNGVLRAKTLVPGHDFMSSESVIGNGATGFTNPKLATSEVYTNPSLSQNANQVDLFAVYEINHDPIDSTGINIMSRRSTPINFELTAQPNFTDDNYNSVISYEPGNQRLGGLIYNRATQNYVITYANLGTKELGIYSVPKDPNPNETNAPATLSLQNYRDANTTNPNLLPQITVNSHSDYILTWFDGSKQFIDRANIQPVVSVSQLTVDNSSSLLYPNPMKTQGTLVLEIQIAENVEIEIVDLMGKIHSSTLHQVISGNNTISINSESLQNGRYILKITSRTLQKSIPFDVMK